MRTDVWYDVNGETGEASFASRDRAEDYIRRVEKNGGTAVMLVPPDDERQYRDALLRKVGLVR